MAGLDVLLGRYGNTGCFHSPDGAGLSLVALVGLIGLVWVVFALLAVALVAGT